MYWLVIYYYYYLACIVHYLYYYVIVLWLIVLFIIYYWPGPDANFVLFIWIIMTRYYLTGIIIGIIVGYYVIVCYCVWPVVLHYYCVVILTYLLYLPVLLLIVAGGNYYFPMTPPVIYWLWHYWWHYNTLFYGLVDYILHLYSYYFIVTSWLVHYYISPFFPTPFIIVAVIIGLLLFILVGPLLFVILALICWHYTFDLYLCTLRFPIIYPVICYDLPFHGIVVIGGNWHLFICPHLLLFTVNIYSPPVVVPLLHCCLHLHLHAIIPDVVTFICPLFTLTPHCIVIYCVMMVLFIAIGPFILFVWCVILTDDAIIWYYLLSPLPAHLFVVTLRLVFAPCPLSVTCMVIQAFYRFGYVRYTLYDHGSGDPDVTLLLRFLHLFNYINYLLCWVFYFVIVIMSLCYTILQQLH